MDRLPDDVRARLHDLMKWRRDLRHFKTDPVDGALLRRCLGTLCLAFSVGLSDPWRILRITSVSARSVARKNFDETNAEALEELCWRGGEASFQPEIVRHG